MGVEPRVAAEYKFGTAFIEYRNDVPKLLGESRVSPIRAGVRVVAFGECMLELQGTAFGAMQQTYGGDTLNTATCDECPF